MKRYILFFCLFIAGLAACKKSDKFDAAAQAKLDDAQIVKYLADSTITGAIKDPTGLYYKIHEPGGDEKPALSNGIYITYEGRLMSNNKVFDVKTSPFYFASIDGLIDGWKAGLPKIGRGGKITLYVPSGMAYKENGTSTVPANSVLIFDVKLYDFN